MKKLTVNPGTKSKLPKPVQNLIKMIFDVESMKKAMVEYEVRALSVLSVGLCWVQWALSSSYWMWHLCLLLSLQ